MAGTFDPSAVSHNSDERLKPCKRCGGTPKLEQYLRRVQVIHICPVKIEEERLAIEAELEAIKNVAQKFPDKKIGIMFPQIISVEETREVKKEFEKFRTDNMEFGVMVETPAACQIIEELCDIGLDFIGIHITIPKGIKIMAMNYSHRIP